MVAKCDFMCLEALLRMQCSRSLGSIRSPCKPQVRDREPRPGTCLFCFIRPRNTEHQRSTSVPCFKYVSGGDCCRRPLSPSLAAMVQNPHDFVGNSILGQTINYACGCFFFLRFCVDVSFPRPLRGYFSRMLWSLGSSGEAKRWGKGGT